MKSCLRQSAVERHCPSNLVSYNSKNRDQQQGTDTAVMDCVLFSPIRSSGAIEA